MLRLESLVALVDHQVLRSLLCCFLRVGLASLWVLVGGGAWPPSAAWGFCAWGFAPAAGLAWLFLGGSSPRGVGPAALWWVVVLWFGGLVVLLGPSGGAAGGRSWPPPFFPAPLPLAPTFPKQQDVPTDGILCCSRFAESGATLTLSPELGYQGPLVLDACSRHGFFCQSLVFKCLVSLMLALFLRYAVLHECLVALPERGAL